MKIGVIGAGFVGQAVGRLLLKAGHQVLLSNSRGPQTLFSLYGGVPGCEIGTVEQACEYGEMVLVAVPLASYQQLPRDKLAGKIVLDAVNYYPERDGQIAALENRQTTTSALLAAHLDRSVVVKVFNAIMARDVVVDARPAGDAERRALPVAGDDPVAKGQVIRLLDQLGYDAVDAGSLAESWRFERSKPAYCFPQNIAALQQALAAAERDVALPLSAWHAVLQREL
ncbi:NADPH-dependent F420 reductase [Photobacterium sp. TY1-4]|uniref:NADPH-dependent F420 reductase n=1 Tax=Photobacterium sp. TY1-4 TaxID=2899122 RepID=UPI0021BF9BEC|nr:NAD(P)-binding domain-containing protein [Photobacterium sp. TY1-4]UXI01369.1 NAD(P)-binding domain-containing protein [Photobacterium sp. TY1-4]